MTRYIVQRLLAAVPVVMIVGVITFSLLHIAPGDPADLLTGDDAPPETVELMQKRLGTDKPFFVQFGIWLKNLATGDFGTSVYSGRSILEILRHRIEPSLSMGIQVVLFSSLMGVSAGVLAAWKAGTPVDRGIMLLAVLGFSVPGFWLATMAIWGLSVKAGLFPVQGYVPFSQGLGAHLHSLALPVIINSVLNSALKARMTRSAMLEVLREDYVRTARAKGLGERLVYWRHAFRNASVPVVTIIGISVATLVTGGVVTETIFAIPGVGRLIVESIARRDYPIIQAMLMIAATGFVLVNLVIDIAYVYLDPRIRYE